MNPAFSRQAALVMNSPYFIGLDSTPTRIRELTRLREVCLRAKTADDLDAKSKALFTAALASMRGQCQDGESHAT